MAVKKADADLVAYCGLYCGECGKFNKGKCPGCADNEKASWCKVRTCCKEHGYSTCADCKEHPNTQDCLMLNNFVARTFSLVFRSNRTAALEKIKKDGRAAYAKDMVKIGRMTYKR